MAQGDLLPSEAVNSPDRSMRPRIGPDPLAWMVVIVVLALASAQAWLGLGRDYLEYVDYYQRIPPFFSFQDTRFEPGFHLIAWSFVNILNLPFWCFVFLIVGTALAIKAYIFRKYLNYPIAAMAVYLATFYPNQEYTQIRAALAISLGMLAIHLFFERRFIWVAVASLAAFSFHYSIIILIVAFALAYVLRRNLLSVIIVAVMAILMVGALASGGGLNNILINWFSTFNPLVGSYVDNVAAIDAASIWSVNNLIVIGMFFSAAAGGWLSKNFYQKCFTIMFGLSVTFVVLLSQAPIIAVRAKEMLLVSVVFAAFRLPLGRRDIIPISLVLANATLLLFLAIREGVILSSS